MKEIKIVCIDKDYLTNITVGKSYVICEYFDDKNIYCIKNDKGDNRLVAGNRFVTLKEHRRRKLEKISNL